MKIQSFIRAGAALTVAVFLSSCFEITNNVALNPDGSGKFVYKTTMPSMPMNLNFGGEDVEAPNPADLAKTAAKELVKSSEGVDVWEKLEFKTTDDGKMTIFASGYFKDVTKLKLGDSDNGPSFTDGMTFTKTDDGNVVLEVKMDMDDKKKPGDADDEEKPKLTDEEVMAKIKESRAQWGAAKGMMTGMLGTMKVDMNIKMPGKIISSTNFKKKGDDVAGLSFTGQSMVDMMDKVIMDDKLAKKVVSEGGDLMGGDGPPPLEGDAMNELIFGEKAPIKVVSEAGEPSFDYAEHVAKAKAGQSAELKALLAE